MDQGSNSLIQYRDGSWIRLNTDTTNTTPYHAIDTNRTQQNTSGSPTTVYDAPVRQSALFTTNQTTLRPHLGTGSGLRRHRSLQEPRVNRRQPAETLMVLAPAQVHDNPAFYREGGVLYELPITKVIHGRPHMTEPAPPSTSDKHIQVSIPLQETPSKTSSKKKRHKQIKHDDSSPSLESKQSGHSGTKEERPGSKEEIDNSSKRQESEIVSPKEEIEEDFESLKGSVKSFKFSAGRDSVKIEDVSINNFTIPKDVPDHPPPKKRCCAGGARVWCLKYFWEGQSLTDARLESRYRRPVALLLPAVVFQVCWWGIAIKYSLWHLFPEKYFMTLCMVVGSIIAGMTSEGGGAIAFPVMTLAFNIAPSVARDFSLMIQSCGMTAAAASIFMMRIQLEHHSMALCTIGGAIGIIFGFNLVDPHLTPAQKKMGFVSIWFSFAFALFLLNRIHKRKTFVQVPEFCLWKGILLLCTGVVGGIFSSFSGSGLDICSFSMLTLLFRVSEKVATPTSVVLMAGNSVIGFYWRGVMSSEPISQEAWDFLAVCVPVVVVGAPLGSVLGSHFHRQVLASFVYIVDIAALVGAFALVPLSPALLGASVAIIVGGFAFFMMVTYAGHRLMRKIIRKREKIVAGHEEKTVDESEA